MKSLIIILVSLYVTEVYAGEYIASKGWPTGIRTHIYTLPEEGYTKCKSLGELLNISSRVDKPYTCGALSGEISSDIIVPAWEKATNKINSILYSFSKADFESKNMITNQTSVYDTNRKKITLYKQNSSQCKDKNNDHSRGRFAFLNNNGNTIHELRGLGIPSDIFLYKDKTYLISYSERDWDDSFKYKLSSPQSVIYLHELYRRSEQSQLRHIISCRFLYESN